MSWPTAPSSRRRRSSWWSTLAIIGGLAVIAAAMLIIPPLLAPPEPTPPPTRTDSAAPSVALSPYRSVAWRIVPLNGLPEDARINGLVETSGRVFAVDAGGETFRAWYSDDVGEHWTAVTAPDLDPPAEGAILHAGLMAADEDRIVASGGWFDASQTQPLGNFVLVSEDHGSTWRFIPQPAQLRNTEFTLLLGIGRGFLAYGVDILAGSSGWWQSADGNTWAPASVSGLSTFSPPQLAVSAPQGLVAVGTMGSGRSTHPAAWFSENGQTWELTLDEPARFGQVGIAAAGAAGYAIAGSRWDSAASAPVYGIATVWRSVDGRSWTAVDISGEVGWVAAGLATNAAGTLAIVINVSDTIAGTGVPRAVFLPAGSEATSAVEIPSFASMVAVGDRFLGVGYCPPDSGCAVHYVLVGTPSEAADSAPPQLPGG